MYMNHQMWVESSVESIDQLLIRHTITRNMEVQRGHHSTGRTATPVLDCCWVHAAVSAGGEGSEKAGRKYFWWKSDTILFVGLYLHACTCTRSIQPVLSCIHVRDRDQNNSQHKWSRVWNSCSHVINHVWQPHCYISVHVTAFLCTYAHL